MLRTVIFMMLTTTIVGCGSGSENNTSPGSGNGSVNNSDPLSQYINISSQYNGLKTAANLDLENVSRFMEAITILQPELLPDYDDEVTLSDTLCVKGGSVVTTSNKANTEIALRFNQCNENGKILNGDATIRVVKRNPSGEVTEGVIIYQDTSLSYKGMQLVLRGSIRQRDIESSCDTTQNLNNLLMTRQGHSEQWYFENFYDQRFGKYGIYCQGDGLLLQGRVYIGDLGFVNVTTPQLLKLPSMVVAQPEQGQLSLAGANGQVFHWQLKDIGTIYKSILTHQFTLNGDGGFHYVYRSEDLTNLMMTDFRDSDGDGMPDAWEIFFGLNPLDPKDSSDDSDADGYTNLQEFKYLGNPKDANILPFIYHIDVSLQHTPGRNQDLIVAETLLNHLNGAMAINSELHYVTAAPLQFSHINHLCSLSDNKLEARCPIRQLIPGTGLLHSIFLETTDAYSQEIQGQLSVKLNTFGLNTSAKITDDIVISRDAAVLNLSLNLSANETGAVMSFLDEEHTLTFYTGQSGHYDPVAGYYVHLNLPDNIEVLSMRCRVFYEWQPCQSPFASPTLDSLRIEVATKAAKTGISHGEFKVLTPDQTTEIASINFPIIVGYSSAELQEQIDHAASGSIINVAAEVYIGSLDMSVNNVTLKGTGQETYLLGQVLSSDYSQRMLLLDHGSEISDFTLANLSIHTGPNGAGLISNRMGAPEILQMGNNIIAEASIILKKNLFSTAGFELDYLNNKNVDFCSHIYLTQNDSDIPFDFIFENNLMVNHGLPQVYCRPIVVYGGYNVTMEHNTISDIYEFVSLNMGDETKTFTMSVKNNVFNNINTVIDRRYGFEHFFYSPEINVSITHNLFDQTEYPVRNPHSSISIADNLFQASGLNLSGFPLPGSAVIDAAAAGDITEDVFGNPRPVDGNGDGIARPDIGAIEKQQQPF